MKRHKRKHQESSTDSSPNGGIDKGYSNSSNTLLEQQISFLSSLSHHERDGFFCHTLDPSRRSELWMRQAELGEKLVDSYSWATPDRRAMRVLKHFSPIVEIGAGQGYWLNMMKEHGIDAVGYDVDPTGGGKISKSRKGRSRGSYIQKGGPEVLKRPENQRRALFLCYPDEDTFINTETRGNDAVPETGSLASACLNHYTGDYVIHVGELFMDSTMSMDQAPWGRSSSPEFQEQLAAQFHCVLKLGLTSWLHVRDTLSVWKRSQVCQIVFQAEDGDEESDEECEYRHIPVEERLPTDLAAPCLEHLLSHNQEDDDDDTISKEPPHESSHQKTGKRHHKEEIDYMTPW